MSATDAPPPPETAPAGTCPRCGAPVRPDQDWCLNCGTAVTTEVAGAPGWRTPIAIVGAVLAVAAAALVFAFVQLSDDADQVAQAPAGTATPAPTAAVTPAPTTAPDAAASPSPDGEIAPAPTTAPDAGVTPDTPATDAPDAGGGEFAEWPAGTDAYTVILWSAETRSGAEAKARELESAGVGDLGILDSDEYSSLRGGYFVVFNGQYDSLEAAQDAAEAAQPDAPGAYAKQVTPR